MIQLLEAEVRFTGTPETWPAYAWPRIKGTILDEIRKTKPRGFRRRRHDDTPVIVSINEFIGETDQTLSDTIPDIKAIIDHDPVAEQKFADAISALSVNERVVVELMIDQDLSSADIAKVLGVTNGRVSQMAKAIRHQLVESLAHPMLRKEALCSLRSESFLRDRVRSGHSVREIADELGVARTSVREWMRLYQIQPVNR